MPTSTFAGEGGPVSVSATGALTGTGTTLSPLAVAVDGVTITIVGNQLVAAIAAVPGATTQVIFNDAGTLAGDSGLTFNKTLATVRVGPPEASLSSDLQGVTSGLNLLTVIAPNVADSFVSGLGIEAQNTSTGGGMDGLSIAVLAPFATAFNGRAFVSEDDGEGVGFVTFTAVLPGIDASTLYGGYLNSPSIGAGSTADQNFALWINPQRNALVTNSYAIWYAGGGGDAAGGGVWRLNDLGVVAYYNPSFDAYTPGAADYERIVTQWNSNVAEIGNEAGGTGVLRALKLIGASVELPALTNGTAIKTNTTTAHTALLQAYDVDNTQYRTFGTLLNGNVPRFTVSQPSGGVLAIIPPTSDPGVSGAIWNNAGTLAIST